MLMSAVKTFGMKAFPFSQESNTLSISLRSIEEMLPLSYRIFILFIVFDLVISYSQVKKCPGNVTGDLCMDYCHYDLSIDKKNPISIDDFKRLARAVRLYDFYYNKTNEMMIWTPKRNGTNRQSRITVTTFFLSEENAIGTPIRTCCGVSILARNCSVSVKDAGRLYIGLTRNVTRIGYRYHVAQLEQKPYKSCWWKNDTIQLCLFVNISTGAIEVNALQGILGVTSAAEYAKDVVKGQIGKFCVYQLPKHNVERNGTKLTDGLYSMFFNRQVWSVTKYWEKSGERNCSIKNISLDPNLNETTKPGHLLCFQATSQKSEAQMEQYCMPGNVTVAAPEKDKVEADSLDLVLVIFLCIIGGVILLLILIFGTYNVSGKFRKFIGTVTKMPPSVMDMEKTLAGNRSGGNFVTSDEYKEEAEPLNLCTADKLVPDKEKHFLLQNEFGHEVDVPDVNIGNRPQLENRTDSVDFVPSTVEGYLDKPEVQSSSFTDDSSGLTDNYIPESMCSSSGVSSGLTSAGIADIDHSIRFEPSSRHSETSEDTGRGSAGCNSENETDMPSFENSSPFDAGSEPSDFGKPDDRLSFGDDVFDELKMGTAVGPPPGSEKMIHNMFFAKSKHISTDSAVGHLSQSEALPDYSLLAH